MGSTFLAAVTAWADDRDPTFDIPSQTLGSALIEFSEQADVQVVVASNATAGIRAPRVTGQFSAREALTALLANSGLQFQAVGEKTFALAQAAPAAAARPTVAAPKTDVRKPADPPAQIVPKGDQTAGVRREEIVVTGSRLPRAEDEGPVPVTVFTREMIDKLGVTTVADVLSYLPQQSFERNDDFAADGRRFVQLRGLGIGTTLILINGRRTVTSALAGSTNVFDLSSVPLAAVERVEVLSDSASAVYGSDAIGGVVNIILKNRVDQTAIDLYYGAAEGGADQRRASLTLGRASDRFRYSMILDAFDRSPLYGSERSLSADQDYRRFGGRDRRGTIANPGNVSSTTAANLPGLPSRIAAVPAGSTGLDLTPADFLPTAGQQNLDSTFRSSTIVPETTRYGAVLIGEFDFTERLRGFGELAYADREGKDIGGPYSTRSVVPAANPFNPFGVAVMVDHSFRGMEPSAYSYSATFWRAVAGLRATLSPTWEAEVSVLATDEHGKTYPTSVLDAARVSAALAATNPAEALNLFVDGPAGSRDLLESLIAPQVANNHYSKSLQGGAVLRGSVYALPAGDLGVIIGAEKRSEDLHFVLSAASITAATRDSAAGFVEFRLPLVDDGMHIPALRRLVVTAAGRYDDYSDFGGTFNPEYGIEWQPLSPLLLRATYGTSFRAPSLFRLYQPPTTRQVSTADPARGESTPITLLSGGNPSLEPEEAESWTYGFVFSPAFSWAPKISASRWSIDQSQRVQALSATTMLANEELFLDRIVRAPATPADIAAGIPGRLSSIDTTSVNFGSSRTSGLDLSVSALFQTRLGDFSPSLSATWVEEYRAADVPGAPISDRVGIANINGTIPEWRGTAMLSWSKRWMGLMASARYTSSYDDATTASERTGRAIPSQTLLDLQATVDLAGLPGQRARWLKGLTMRVGARNLLDEGPSYAEIGGTLGFDSSQGDLLQRFLYASVTARF